MEAGGKFPHTTIQCLTAIAQHHGIQIHPEKLIDDYALAAEEPSPSMLLRIATDIGLKASLRKLSWEKLLALGAVFPILVRLNTGGALIVVGVKGEDGGKVAVVDPLKTDFSVDLLERAQFVSTWNGDVVFLKRTYAISDSNQPFGLRWFIPEILKQKTAFRDIAVTAFALQLLGLASPLFFQLVIDKVLVHQSSGTLWALGVGVIIAMVFEQIFGFLRSFIVLSATNKIDMRLTRRTFSHLMSLPINYFETTTAGVVVRNILKLESIRNFLTGRLFFAALDLFAFLVFLPMLFSYSFKLAMVTLGFSLAIATVIGLLLPVYQQRIKDVNAAEGKRQSLLVESIHGMRTVKALAIEPKLRRIWDQRSAEAITAHFRLSRIAITANTFTGFLHTLLPVAIIIIGAQDVFDQTMTVGALIAFNMLSGRVMGPLVQIVGIVNEYQEVAVSVQLLGEIMNHPPEGRAGMGGLRPTLAGDIYFEDVTFRYPGSSATALNKASFQIKAGTVVGIVGRSGSGKTTLTKLIQGLYEVEEGLIRFDGIDAREIELTHLRRQIGVVLQENFLFRGTVRENISATRPDASLEEIVEVAQTAGADEFIERLPQGYDTLLEENAANLSGGQKQRLSIARALLSKPRILILDEAASALDPESEAIFMKNLGRISVGRTVIMVSHRLSTLVNAHAILVMQQGRLVDSGVHKELVDRCPTYQQLWNQQTSHI